MAGSLKWFEYTTDNGDIFALQADEGNTEAINGASGDWTSASSGIYAVPRNIRIREATYQSADGARSITVYPLTVATYASLPTSTPTITDPLNSAVTLQLVRRRAENIRLPRPDDTGITDGDAS